MRRGILGQLDFIVGRATQRTIKLTFFNHNVVAPVMTHLFMI